nr:winged helix-turn-helix domain-containing protein [uncultured Bacteroides sp.]
MSDRDLNLAIGWLAREDKIFFERNKDENKEYLYLSLDLYF